MIFFSVSGIGNSIQFNNACTEYSVGSTEYICC